jgi:hypothetical protein
MITLKELLETSGVQEIAPGRTIGEQVYDSSINTVSQDTDLGSDTYTGNIKPYSKDVDPFFSGLQQVTQPLKNIYNNYAPNIIGGIASLATGIPGLGLLLGAIKPNPYARNATEMYGAYTGSDYFVKDKFGYNVGAKNFLEPGSNSYRSYAMQGLRSLDPVVANEYYLQTYGKTYDDVKKDIQKRKDPFNSAGIIDMGSDYQGGGDNENRDFNTRSASESSFADTQTYGGGGSQFDQGADTFI